MRTGFMYWNPAFYRYIMHIIYGKYFYSRYKTVSDLLPNNVDVVDICCGDCYITKFLVEKKINYLGLDLNPKFINYNSGRGIMSKLFNLKTDTIPPADYIIMLGSLYQFIPNHRVVMDELISAANKAVIILEPIRNIAASDSPMIAFLANLATKVNGESMPYRFAKTELLELFSDYKARLIKEIEGGRELIGLFVKNNQR